MDDDVLPHTARETTGDDDLLAALREVLSGGDPAGAAERHGVPRSRLDRWHRRATDLALEAMTARARAGEADVASSSDAALVDHLLEENEQLWDLLLDARAS